MNVRDYIASETERQSGTFQEAIGMYRAWERMLSWSKADEGRRKRVDNILCDAANLMNPLIVGYRSVPVIFQSGGHAVHYQNIPNVMDKLAENLTYEISGPKGSVNHKVLADYWTREFLEIHPFIDCNGRVGSLLWNFLHGTLADPHTMPDFFGEQ